MCLNLYSHLHKPIYLLSNHLETVFLQHFTSYVTTFKSPYTYIFAVKVRLGKGNRIHTTPCIVSTPFPLGLHYIEGKALR